MARGRVDTTTSVAYHADILSIRSTSPECSSFTINHHRYSTIPITSTSTSVTEMFCLYRIDSIADLIAGAKIIATPIFFASKLFSIFCAISVQHSLENTFLTFFFKIQKTRLFTFFEVSSQKNVESVVQFSNLERSCFNYVNVNMTAE